MALKLGDIQFLNSWPVTYALRQGRVRGASSREVSLVSGSPAELNRKLLTGELDASAVSSMAFLRHQREWVPIPGLCIRADGGVQSVLVVSRRRLQELKGKTIGVSNQGATTPILLKLLLKKHQMPMELETTSLRYPQILESYPAALLIGDEALVAAQETSRGFLTWDLGEAWSDWTRLPAVFALWAVRRHLLDQRPQLLQELSELLVASYDWGKSHTAELVAQMRRTFPFEANFLKRYLASLSYDLDRKAWVGLRRFAREVERMGELPAGTTRQINAASLRAASEMASSARSLPRAERGGSEFASASPRDASSQ